MSIPSLLKNSAIYSIVSILQKGIMFFLLPIYTMYLTPSDYGVLSVITSMSSFISIFMVLSLDAAARRFYFINNDVDYSKRLWGTIALFLLLNSFFLGILLIVLHKFIIDPLIGDIDFYPYMLLGIIYIIFTPLYLFFQTYLQTRQRGVSYGINMFSNFLLQVILILVFLIVFKLGVLGILLAYVITAFVFFVYVFFVFLPKIKLYLDYKILKSSFRYSFPLIPHSLFAWSAGMVDKLFLNKMMGQTETGLYSVSQQFGGITGVVATSINQAYAPWFFEKESQGEEGNSQIEKIGDLLIIIYCFIALTLSLFSKEILSLMVSEEYRGIENLISILAFGYVFQGVYYLFVNVLFLKHTSMVFIITLISAVVNILLNMILIPIYGMLGAALACMSTLFIQSLLALYFSMVKNKQIRYRWKGIYFNVFLFGGIASFGVLYINTGCFGMDFLCKIGIVVALLLFSFMRFRAYLPSLLAVLKK